MPNMHLLGTLEGNIKNGAILKEIMFSNFPVWMKVRISGQGPSQMVTSSSIETTKLNKQTN